MIVPEINEKTFIDRGFAISSNFLLEHCSSGAIHPVTNDIMPFVTQNWNESQFVNVPVWKLASNMSKSAIFVLEPLLKEYGGDLILRQAFKINLNSKGEIQHQFGNGFDIQIAGEQSNMFNVAKDIQRICKYASNIDLNFAGDSWMHIGINQKKLSVNSTSRIIEPPKIMSVDLINNVKEEGIVAFRGVI